MPPLTRMHVTPLFHIHIIGIVVHLLYQRRRAKRHVIYDLRGLAVIFEKTNLCLKNTCARYVHTIAFSFEANCTVGHPRGKDKAVDV